jgi:hypothetical protein
MQLGDDIKAAKQLRLPWWGMLCWMIGCALGAWLFDHLGRLDLALPTLNGTAVLGFAIAVKWKLRRHAWFWLTMTAIAALHVPLLMFVPWTTKWVPALVIAAIDSVDFCAILAILIAVGKLAGGPKTLKDERPRSSQCPMLAAY